MVDKISDCKHLHCAKNGETRKKNKILGQHKRMSGNKESKQKKKEEDLNTATKLLASAKFNSLYQQ